MEYVYFAMILFAVWNITNVLVAGAGRISCCKDKKAGHVGTIHSCKNSETEKKILNVQFTTIYKEIKTFSSSISCSRICVKNPGKDVAGLRHNYVHIIMLWIKFLKNRKPKGHLYCHKKEVKFYISLTAHNVMILGKWAMWCTNSFLCIYFYL
jgi:hypothetical protein